MSNKNSKRLIADDKQLVDICLSLNQIKTVALDTEYTRESTYYPKPALLQMSDGSRVSLIDTLAIKDFSPIRQLLVVPTITKIIHSARQDIEVLKRLDCALKAPLFDTQLAAAFLNFGSQISYKDLVNKCLGVALEKEQTRSNWLARPLSDSQIDYAMHDVIYLHELYHRLKARLQKSGKEDWFIEESNSVLSNYCELHPKQAWQKVSGRGKLRSAVGLGRLQLLAQWREQKARVADLPRRWVIKDKQLIAVAKQEVPLESLARQVEHNTRQRVSVNLDELEALLATAKFRTLFFNDAPSPQDKNLIGKVKRLISRAAKEYQIEASLIANHKQITSMVINKNKYARAPWLSGWRLKIVGADIDNLVGAKQ